MVEAHGRDVVVADLRADRDLRRQGDAPDDEEPARPEPADPALVALLELVAVLGVVEEIREVREEVEGVARDVGLDAGQARASPALPLGDEDVPVRVGRRRVGSMFPKREMSPSSTARCRDLVGRVPAAVVADARSG